MTFFSWINLILLSVSADNSIAYVKPFSPPYATSTVFNTFVASLGSNKSLYSKSFLNSALPARISPETFNLSAVINCTTAYSDTFLT